MEPIIGPIIAALGVVGVFLCFGVLMLALIGGAVFFLIKRSKTAFVDNVPDVRGDAFLAEAHLRNWDANAFNDMSCKWVGWWRSVNSPANATGEFQGVVQSLSEPTEPGWAAFTVQREQLRNATIKLKTTQHHIEVKVSAESRLNPNTSMTVSISGEPSGTIAVDFPVHTFTNLNGSITGVFKRRAAVAVRTKAYAPVEINGQQVAELTDVWFRQPHTKRDPHEAWQNVSAELNAEQQTWLLVMLAVDLYYDSMWQRKYD